MKTRNAFLIFSLTFIFNYFSSGQTSSNRADIEKKIDKCLGSMSLEEKVGQMTQVTIDVISVGRKGASDLAFVNRNLEWITEPGDFEVEIGGLKRKFELRD